MTEAQRIAIEHACLLGGESWHPRFETVTPTGVIRLSVNSGFQ